MKVEHSIALVTGAASGLGLATCRTLAESGARVVALDRDASALAHLMAEFGSDRLLADAVDVADDADVARAIAAAISRFGGLHVAVNCTGVGNAARTISKGQVFPLELWDKVISVNLTGTFNIIRHAALAMSRNEPDPQSGERGVIVNTASGAATQGQVGQAAYSASKAGVIGLTLPVARDLAEWGIRVVTVSPGLFETAMVAGLPDGVRQSLIDKMMLFPARMGQPDEFARLVRGIVENPYINATTIDLDGGARMSAR